MSLLENTSSSAGGATFLSPLRQQMNESDCEKHFKGFGKWSWFMSSIIWNDQDQLDKFEHFSFIVDRQIIYVF